MNKFPIFSVLLIILFITPAFADFQKGVEAVERGDYETAFNEWAPLAELGGAVAQNNLGLLYANGQGVVQDDEAAVKWYTRTAEQGYARSQFNLGVMYING